MCIMNGRCGGGSVPSQKKCPTSGGGILTVVTDNMPLINFNQTTGSVKRTDAVVSLSLGTAGYGTFKRVAYANDARTAYEFRMPPAMSAGNILARVSVHPTSAAIPSVAVFGLQYFDDTIVLQCTSSCQGSASGGNTVALRLLKFPMDAQASVSDQIDVLFGSVPASSVSLVSINGSETRLSVVAPAYACPTCSKINGMSLTDLVVTLKADVSVSAATSYT